MMTLKKIVRVGNVLDEIPDYLALDITTEYQQLKEELAQRRISDGKNRTFFSRS